MATAKKATKKTAAKKAALKSAAKTSVVDTPVSTDVGKTTAKPNSKARLSKEEARAAKEAAIADAPEVKTTINPAGSWPFPTGERP